MWIFVGFRKQQLNNVDCNASVVLLSALKFHACIFLFVNSIQKKFWWILTYVEFIWDTLSEHKERMKMNIENLGFETFLLILADQRLWVINHKMYLSRVILRIFQYAVSVEAEYNYKVYKLQSESIAIVIFVIARYYLLNEVSDTLNMVQ